MFNYYRMLLLALKKLEMVKIIPPQIPNTQLKNYPMKTLYAIRETLLVTSLKVTLCILSAVVNCNLANQKNPPIKE